MSGRRGITLLEVALVAALLSIVMAVAGGIALDVMRVASREETLLEMDRDANRTMETARRLLRLAYVPVAAEPLAGGRRQALAAADLEKTTRGWLGALRRGSDCLAFLTPVDPEGEGDVLYGDSRSSLRLKLGVDAPGGPLAATDKDDTLENLGLIDMDPTDPWPLGLDLATGTGPEPVPDLGSGRFAVPFVYPKPPGGRKQIYWLIRFAPWRENGLPLIIDEGGEADLNDDGDQDDSFALGRLELVYPKTGGGSSALALCGYSLLLTLNPREAARDAIFLLLPGDDDFPVIRLRLLFCQTGNSPWSLGGKRPPLSRTFETLAELKLMAEK